jgi:hypothetical protein
LPESAPLVRVSPRSVVRRLSFVTGGLVAAHVGFLILRFGFGHDVVFGVARWFNLDREANVPTFFSALLLGLAAALLALSGTHHARRHDPAARQWVVLAWIFAFLSLDEVAGIHERLGIWLRHAVALDEWVHFVWPLPAIVLVAALYLAYWPWFAALDRATRRGVVIAAAVYLAGAVGMELVSGFYWARTGSYRVDLAYAGITTVEETLEMLGMLLFIRVLLQYASARGWGFAIGGEPSPAVSRTVQARPPE